MTIISIFLLAVVLFFPAVAIGTALANLAFRQSGKAALFLSWGIGFGLFWVVRYFAIGLHIGLGVNELAFSLLVFLAGTAIANGAYSGDWLKFKTAVKGLVAWIVGIVSQIKGEWRG